MHKILSTRITLAACLFLAACASGPEKRTNNDQGPVSARARNVLASENPQGLVTVAEGFERTGNLEGAYNLYSQAIAAAPELLSAKLGLARIYAKINEADRAKVVLESLEGDHGSDPEYILTSVEILTLLANYNQAEIVLEPLSSQANATAPILNMAGRLSQINGRPKRARDYFDRALGIQPGNSAVLRNLAISFAIDGQYESAVALLQRAMDSPLGATDAKRTLAYIYALSGQLKAANVIASSVVPQDEIQELSHIFRLLPRFTPAEQASVLMFDRVPVDALQRTTK